MSIILTQNVRINTLITNCVDNMKKWNYNVPNTIKFVIVEPRRFLGQCVFAKNGNPLTIKLNRSLINHGTENDITETIYHELIHASLPKGTHHNATWCKVAKEVNEKTGLHISRLADSSKLGADYYKEYKYVFRCKKCGKIIGLSRMTRFVKNYNKKDSNGEPLWWHSKDHGEFERIK
ncbi:MAG: SprT-like domain-containing protein [Prevotellaceae bacterium]|nr:SprT-like domain-containing protein [Candidatus Colivivens equi]